MADGTKQSPAENGSAYEGTPVNKSAMKTWIPPAAIALLIFMGLVVAMIDNGTDVRPLTATTKKDGDPRDRSAVQRTVSRSKTRVGHPPEGPSDAPPTSASGGSNPWKTETHPAPSSDASEVETTARNHLRGLRNAMIAYQGSFDALVEALPCPEGEIGTSRLRWTGQCVEDWDEIGWRPGGIEAEDGVVVTDCQYSIELYDDIEGFVAVARCDENLDGIVEEYFVDFER